MSRPTNEFSPALRLAIERLAPSRATVLVRGGSAADRARVARALHERSNRSAEPFRELDVLDTEALEELFGGPVSRGPRQAIPANRGTLHVVVAEALPPIFQPRFMSFLDEGERPRVVVSTSVDLALAAREGRFRKDLAERLLLVHVVVSES